MTSFTRDAARPEPQIDLVATGHNPGFKEDDALSVVREIVGLELATEIVLHPIYQHNGLRTVRIRVSCISTQRLNVGIELAKVAARRDAEITMDGDWYVFRPGEPT